MSIFNKYTDIESLISKDALEARKHGLETLIANAKEDVASYEDQLKAIVEKLKSFTTDVVEEVKEEVKKAAPKRSTKKSEAKAEESEAKSEKSDKEADSDK